MTRFGVMKHLRVLEEAGLVTTQRRGREKLHFLNPVPIRLVHDRWVSKFAEPWAAIAERAQGRLEEEMKMTEQTHTPVIGDRGAMTVFEIYIKTTPERLWEAITEREMKRQLHLRRRDRVRLHRGLRATVPPPARTARSRSTRARTSRSIRPAASCRRCGRCGATRSGTTGFSRVTWEIEQIEDSCRLRVTHDQLPEGANNELYGGWPMILSGLKTLLETGEDADDPGLAALRGARAEAAPSGRP